MREVFETQSVGADLARRVWRAGASRRLRDIRENEPKHKRANDRRREDGAQFPSQNAHL